MSTSSLVDMTEKHTPMIDKQSHLYRYMYPT